MEKHANNVIIFPKWKKHLEKDSLRLLKERKYIEALNLFEQLIKLGEMTHEAIFGKLLCLAELERFSEATDLLEDLILDQKDTRFEYVHMYVTMLYQQKEFDQLINVVDETNAIKKFPKQYRDHIEHLYMMSKTYRAENAKQLKDKYSERLINISETNLYQEQRHIIHTLRKGNVRPIEEVFQLLQNKKVHPVIKTDLLLWFKEININEELQLEKLGMHKSIIPTQLVSIPDQAIYVDIFQQINHLEDDNPSLLALMEKTFKRFLYVWYPFPLDEDKLKYFVKALKMIVKVDNESNQSSDFTPAVEEMMKTISICEALYLSVVEE